MLACASDCQDIMVSAAAGHDCHVAKPQSQRAEHFHQYGCVGHSPPPRSEKPLGEDEPQGADHQVMHTPVIADSVFVELPEPLLLNVVLALELSAPAQPNAHAALEAAHQAEPDPEPVPLPASVSLLL